MKETLIGLINYAFENQDDELAQYIYKLLEELAWTFNAPSDWRELGTEFAAIYSDNKWVMENCKLYEFSEE